MINNAECQKMQIFGTECVLEKIIKKIKDRETNTLKLMSHFS